MQKNIFYIFGFSIISYLLYVLSNNNSECKDIQNKEDVVINLDENTIKIETPPADSRTTIETPFSFNNQNITEPRHHTHSFEEVMPEDMPKDVKSRDNILPIVMFKIERKTIKNLILGDLIDLPTINGITYTGKVIQKKKNSNGSVTIITKLQGEDDKHYSVLTEGDSTSFISIFSPSGNFELNSVNGYGYGYSSKDIRDTMIDFSKKDTIIPPHDD